MDQHHKLRGARKDRGWTQAELGRRSNVSTGTISNIECHRGPDVPREQLRLTKTKYSTAAKLVNAVMESLVMEYGIPGGNYDPEKLVKLVNDRLGRQQIFSLLEIYEIARIGQPKRKRSRNQAAVTQPVRHLAAV